MKNLLLSAAIGDIAGSAYESRYNSTKNYDAVEMFSSHARFTDDTVCTFACAEALLDNLDMADNLWKRTNGHPHAGSATGSGFGWLHLSIILMAATATAVL